MEIRKSIDNVVRYASRTALIPLVLTAGVALTDCYKQIVKPQVLGKPMTYAPYNNEM